MTKTFVEWKGHPSLKRMLVPIASLEPWPNNPRVSNVDAIQLSLRRFGQLKPIVIHGFRIVAGHHIVLAAQREGWTKVAAVDNDFDTEEEARAYLLADNRTSDLGAYDDQLLADQLHAYAASELDWEGTGYDQTEYEAIVAELRKQGEDPLARRGQREHRDPGMKDLVLTYDAARFTDIETWLGIVGRELGLSDAAVSEVVYAALRKLAAELLAG